MRDAAFTWRPSWLKSYLFRDLFRELWLPERFLYWGRYYLNVFEFLERKIYAFVAKLSDRCFCWFPTATLVHAHPDGHQYGVSIQISINLGKKLLCISRIRKIAVPESWREPLHSYLLSFIRFVSQILLNGFDIYFDLFKMAWHWKPAIDNYKNCDIYC